MDLMAGTAKGEAMTADSERLNKAWLRGGGIWLLVLGALLLSFADTVSSMVSTWWNSASYNHCFLVPLISGYLVWERRALFSSIAPRILWPGVAAVLAFSGLWLIGRLGGAMVVEQFALVFMIQASVLAIFGWPATRALALPLGFLLFAVPFGDFLVAPLQDFTAVFTVWALRLIDIPVFMEGVFISTPSGDFHVAEACSGVRFLIATVPLGVLFADIAFKSWFRRAAVVALSILVPIIANGIRAFGIVYIAYLTDNEYATGVDHLVYGWIFFSIVIFLLIAIGMMFADKPAGEPAFKADGLGGAQRPARFGQFTAIAVVIVALANIGPLGQARVVAATENFTLPALTVPVAGGDWRPVEARSVVPWKPAFRGVDAELMQVFERTDGVRVSFYYGYYGAQRQGAEVVQFGNTVAAPSPWEWSSRTMQQLTDIGVAPQEVIETHILTRHRQRLVWHWYRSGGHNTTSSVGVKVSDLWAKLTGGETAGAVIAVSVEKTLTDAAAEKALADFLSNLSSGLPGLGTSL